MGRRLENFCGDRIGISIKLWGRDGTSKNSVEVVKGKNSGEWGVRIGTISYGSMSLLIHENGVGDWNILFIVLCHSVTESSILPDSVICTYWHLWLILAVVSDLLGSGEVQLHAHMKKKIRIKPRNDWAMNQSSIIFYLRTRKLDTLVKMETIQEKM